MLNNLTIRTRLIFVIGFLVVQMIVGAFVGCGNVQLANELTKTIYDDRLIAIGQLDQVVRLLNVNQLTIVTTVTGDPMSAVKQMNDVEANIQTVNRVLDVFMATDLTPDEKRLSKNKVRNAHNKLAGRTDIGSARKNIPNHMEEIS